MTFYEDEMAENGVSSPHYHDRVEDEKTFSSTQQQKIEIVTELLTQRFSCRYFLTEKVPNDELIHSILNTARHAPSGSNFQPWKVHILRGDSKNKLAQIITNAHEKESHLHQAPYAFYPSNDKLALPDYKHLQTRRKEFGKQFYGPLNIAHDDREGRRDVTARNWRFFDAPIGFLITTLDDAPAGSYLDVGFFVMAVIVALRSHGLECCVQEAHATFHALYAKELNFTNTESVVCGMAIGHADVEKVQKLTGRQEKMSVQELATFHD
jgi:nitroreductase